MSAAQTFLGNEMAPGLHPCTHKPHQNIYTYSFCLCVFVSCVGGGRQSIFLYICMTEQLCTLDRFTQRAGIGEPSTFPAFSPSQKTIAPLLNIATATFVPFLFRLLEPLSHTCACLCKILYGFPVCPCLSVHLLNMRSPIFLFYVHKRWDV